MLPPDRRAQWLSASLPSIFLPPRHEPLLVVAEDHDLAVLAAAHLSDRGRGTVMSMALDRAALKTLPADLLRKGRCGHMLWRPPEFLRRWAHLLPPPAAGGVLDLACGSGRAAVWLAMRGWQVTGVDHQPEALALAARLGTCCGVGLDLLESDLRVSGGLPIGTWASILMFRFLERDLVAQLPSRLAPGGVVMLSTFRDAPGYLGNPRPIHRLRRNEATTFWARDRMDILVHQEGFDGDRRPTAGVVARRAGLVT